MRLLPFGLLVFASVCTLCTAFAAESKAPPPKPLDRPAHGSGSLRLVKEAIRREVHVFKTTPQGELRIQLHYPSDWKATDRRPVMVFFFGGGWRVGSATQFMPQAEYFASRGLVCALVEYRIASIHRTKQDMCVEDAKSAVRWVRGQAAKLGVDPEKVIAAGGSAGGHLAAAVAFVEGFDAADDNRKISTVPNALVLFNPALNFSGDPSDRSTAMLVNAAGESIARRVSPFHLLKPGAPPTILFFGTADQLLPEHGQAYSKKAKDLGNRCELWTAAGQPHGFFNTQPWAAATVIQADKFLASLGYLQGPPTLAPASSAAVLVPVK